MPVDLGEMSVIELLQLSSSVIDELKKRKIVRTKNNPVADYTEWLAAEHLSLELATKSNAGYDGIDNRGVTYQVKGRRTTPDNRSRQLGVIRDYDKRRFDFLVAVIYDKDYHILDAALVPHEVIGEYATYKGRVNGHILHLQGKILEDPRVRDIKKLLER